MDGSRPPGVFWFLAVYLHVCGGKGVHSNMLMPVYLRGGDCARVGGFLSSLVPSSPVLTLAAWVSEEKPSPARGRPRESCPQRPTQDAAAVTATAPPPPLPQPADPTLGPGVIGSGIGNGY